MITLIEARTPQGTLLSLPLEDTSSGIVVEAVNGLDPVKATIVSSSFSAMDGAQYQSSRRDIRNITMTLGLDPDYVSNSVRDLRKKLYGFFMPESEVTLRFHMDDGLVVDILGRVESFVSPLFAQEPKVDISVICFDPDFIGITPVSFTGTTVPNTIDTLVAYDGTLETGFTFVLSVDRDLTEFTIYNRPVDNVVRTLDFAASLVAGDVLTISTITGSKSVILTRAGVDSSLLYGMSAQSNWINFMPGDNHIRVYAVGAAISYSIAYTARYGGL